MDIKSLGECVQDVLFYRYAAKPKQTQMTCFRGQDWAKPGEGSAQHSDGAGSSEGSARPLGSAVATLGAASPEGNVLLSQGEANTALL